jgi:hypothetical protein
MATLAIVAYFAVPPATARMMATLGPTAGPALTAADRLLEETYPPARIEAILTTGFSETPRMYLLSWQVLADLAAALAFFGAAWLGFDRFTTDAPARGGMNVLAGGPPRRWFRPGRAWKRALAWKDFHFLAGGMPWLLLRVVVLAGVAAALAHLEYVEAAPFVGIGSWRDLRLHQWLTLLGKSPMLVALVGGAVEMSVVASRIFREEVHGRTLVGLLMTPHSTAAVAWQKVLGCLLGLLPAAACFAAGAALDPDSFFDGLRESSGSLQPWYYLLMFVTFLHLTALLSLIVRWGALPLALVITVFAMSCLFMPVFLISAPAAMATGSMLAALAPLAGTHACLCAILQHVIAARLRDVAEG